MGTHSVMIAPGFFLGPWHPENLKHSLDTAELLNHSCQPNLAVQGQIVLVARRAIEVGEELTYDYETTDTEGMRFECQCGAPGCRGVIDGQAWQRPEWRAANAGCLSWNVLETIRLAGQ
ncbi:MAG: SET domain-containing protein-lysine N-methyltransferase [Planctomycetaceae bacterium]